MNISIGHRRVPLLPMVLALGTISLVAYGIILMMGVGQAGAATKESYNQEDLSSDKTFKYEIAKYKRFGNLSTTIESDVNVEVYPENARTVGWMSVDTNGDFSEAQSEVRSGSGELWYSTVIRADGTSTTTNHRNGRIITESLPASMLVADRDATAPSVGDKLVAGGWTKTGTDEFNGKQVDVYGITISAEGRTPADESAIQLPYLEDLDPASFKQQSLVSSELNMVLKHSRWSVDEDGNEVLVEETEILKSKVE